MIRAGLYRTTVTWDEEYSVHFVRTWGEAVLRQVQRVRQMRARDADDLRAYDRVEEWGPDEEQLQQNFRYLWAEEHLLVVAAHQLELWRNRLADERGDSTPQPVDAFLAGVRHTIEHLNEADFKESVALPGDRGSNRSLRALGQLSIAVGGRLAFGLVDVDELEQRTLAVVGTVEDELEQAAVDRYVELMRD